MTRPNLLQLKLSPRHSVDLVRLPERQRYLIVFAERDAFNNRVFADISYDEAAEAAAFLLGKEPEPPPAQEFDEGPTGVDTPSGKMHKLDKPDPGPEKP